jgi:beta-aspartyl-dipeptidase (metallo-type)
MESPLILLVDAEVFAPEPLGRRHVLLGGGRILSLLEDRPEMPSTLPVETVDLAGRRLIPGLVDGHVHLTGGGGEGGYGTRIPPLFLSEFTTAGVTTVLGVLGTDDSTRTTASLLAATRALRDQGLSAYCLTGGYHLPPTTLTGRVMDDILHLDPVVGVGEIAISDHRSSQPTIDELLRVASDAHVAGMLAGKAGLTQLHVGTGERGLALVCAALETSELPPRIFQPTHVNRREALLEEAFALATAGSTIDVTAFPVRRESAGVPAVEAVRLYLERELPPERITVSSDAGGSVGEGRKGRPGALFSTLGELVERGIPLEDALPAFTSNAADVLGLAAKGRIRGGADADLVVLDGSFAVDSVLARGRWHVRDGRPVVLGTWEATPPGAS